jgi:hypothetical protein
MAIKHILKDGTVLEDISGIVITREQNPEVYRIIEQIRKKERDKHEKKSEK